MPSPFPGMYPYLEKPSGWQDVHHLTISAIAIHLNQRLPTPFRARIEERVYVAE